MSDPFNNLSDDEPVPGLPPIKMEAAVVREAPAPRKVEANVVGPRVRIILEDSESIPPTGLFLGADGVGYMLKANLPADVPASIIGILDTAVMSTPVVDPETLQVTGYRDRLRFPYRVVAHIPASVREAA
jgi:hypothetical protein